MRARFIRSGIVALLALALAACQEGGNEAGPGARAPGVGQAEAPPPPVGVVEVRTEEIPVVSELPGRVSPTRIAEVRPRVGGIIVRRVFEQGSFVEEGQPLFEIDPATYQVQVTAAQAAVARAEAVLLQATQEASRAGQLVQNRAGTQANLDTANAVLAQARADVLSAQANQRAAEINLEYATVRAPISGRIGRALVTEGALVSTTGAEALATIQQLDPVYADIQQPVAQLMALREALRSGRLTEVEPDVAQVRLLMDDGSQYEAPGRLLFSEATVDEASGQVTLRAEFPNVENDLLPGMYVRVAIEQGIDANAIAVPNQAIQRDTAGRSLVYLVGAEDVVEQREVTVARVIGNRSVISQGLSPGDRVIADGFQKTGPGAPVTPVPWQEPGAAPAANENVAANPAEAAQASPDDAQPAPDAASPAPDAAAEATGDGASLDLGESTGRVAVPTPRPTDLADAGASARTVE